MKMKASSFPRVCMAALMILGIAAASARAAEWKPSNSIEWVLTVNPGGGNDIFVRTILDILKTKGISDADFVVNYQTDGNGEVAKLRVATAGPNPYIILGFTSADLITMNVNGNMTLDQVKPIAVLASDKHVLLVNRKTGRFKSLEDVMKAIAAGESVTFGGARSDDEALYHRVSASLKFNEDDVPFVGYGSNADSLTALLGDHIDVCISKLAASNQYLVSGDLAPIAALSTERFTAAPFDTAPTLKELGYENVEDPIWRSIIASPDIPKEAEEYYIRIFKEMSKTPEWDQYIKDKLSAPMYFFGEDAMKYMKEYEAATKK